MWILTRLPSFGHHLSECYLATESVKLDRQISLNGKDSKCYSVEPVLRCQPGCAPVRTTSVNVGFHCVPAGEWNKKTSRGQARMLPFSVRSLIAPSPPLQSPAWTAQRVWAASSRRVWTWQKRQWLTWPAAATLNVPNFTAFGPSYV